jgi:hypothetical protein
MQKPKKYFYLRRNRHNKTQNWYQKNSKLCPNDVSGKSNRSDRSNSLPQDRINKKIKFEQSKTGKNSNLEPMYVREDTIPSHNFTINII